MRSLRAILLLLCLVHCAYTQRHTRSKRLGQQHQPMPKTDHEKWFGTENRCMIYVLNHYGFLWNIVRVLGVVLATHVTSSHIQVHTIEYVAYHPQLDIYLEWPWSDYQCPGFEGRAWWYWLNSTAVKPHTLAPPDCPRRAYSGSPEDNPTRFVDWILNTRADIVKQTGLPELTVTFGPVDAAQQAVREVHMKRLGYLPRLPEVVPQLWVLSDHLATLADWEWSLLARLRRPLVGIHLRGGDKHGENIAMFGEAVAAQMANTTLGIEKLVARHGDAARGGTCFLVGDGSVHVDAVTASAKALLDCHVVNQVPPGSDYTRDTFIQQKQQDLKCLAGTSVFVFIELLGRADFVVGSLHNAPYNVASFVRQYKHNKPQDTCIDNADFGQPTFMY